MELGQVLSYTTHEELMLCSFANTFARLLLDKAGFRLIKSGEPISRSSADAGAVESRDQIAVQGR